MKDSLTTSIIGFVSVVTAAIAISFLLSYPYMIIWNQCLVPAIPALREVEWLQMWAITILAHGLFKSTGK